MKTFYGLIAYNFIFPQYLIPVNIVCTLFSLDSYPDRCMHVGDYTCICYSNCVVERSNFIFALVDLCTNYIQFIFKGI